MQNTTATTAHTLRVVREAGSTTAYVTTCDGCDLHVKWDIRIEAEVAYVNERVAAHYDRTVIGPLADRLLATA